jgi:hypothetical protein
MWTYVSHRNAAIVESSIEGADLAQLAEAFGISPGSIQHIIRRAHMAGSYRPPSREGKAALTVWVEPALAKQLKQLALDENTTVQTLVVQAINDLLAKRTSKQSS